MCLGLPPAPERSQGPGLDPRRGLGTGGPTTHTGVGFFLLYNFLCLLNNLQGARADFIILRMTITEKELTPRIRGVYEEATERLKGHRYTHLLSALQRHSYRSGPSPQELLAPLACPLAGLLCSKQRGWGHCP